MKKIIFQLLIWVSIIGCKTERDVGPAAGTFLRYFGSENNQDAVLAMEAGNGYSLLSNVVIQKGATDVDYKIRLTHTDQNGNFAWEKTFPAFVKNENEAGSARGFSFIQLANSGYLIVGEWIKPDGTSKLLLVRTDPEGNMQDSVTISAGFAIPSLSGASLEGRAVIETSENNEPYYVVLARISGGPSSITNDMLIARINSSDLSLGWRRGYGAGTSSVINKLYKNNNKNLLWAGSIVRSANQRDVRLIEVPTDSESPVIGNPRVTTDDENAIDFTPTAGGWAITGSTNKSGNDNIYLLKISGNSQFIYEQEISPVLDGETDPQLNDRGNSICQGIDGGLMILGTVETESSLQDLFLVKIEGLSGTPMWRKRIGGLDKEEGASIRTTADNHYLVFATISFSRSRKLMLLKLNRNGEM